VTSEHKKQRRERFLKRQAAALPHSVAKQNRRVIRKMGGGDWIKALINGAEEDCDTINRARKKLKFCQWVENATAPRGCSGIVMREGTIYCPYHADIWEDMLMLHAERKPRVE